MAKDFSRPSISGETMPIAPAEILVGGPESRGEVDRVSDTLNFERNRPGFWFPRCAILLVLASSIASFRQLGDSLGVVIGVMIVGPFLRRGSRTLSLSGRQGAWGGEA
jgi:hypothetical protein